MILSMSLASVMVSVTSLMRFIHQTQAATSMLMGMKRNLRRANHRSNYQRIVRQWLIEHNFMNEPGQTMPEITDEYAESVSETLH